MSRSSAELAAEVFPGRRGTRGTRRARDAAGHRQGPPGAGFRAAVQLAPRGLTDSATLHPTYSERMTNQAEQREHSTKGAYVSGGQDFKRDTNYITTRITADGRDGYPVEPGRYRLVVARACPWANRAIIVRRLLGLEDVLSMGICGPTHDERSWTFDLDPGGVDPVLGIQRLQDAYFARVPRTTRAGITVPAIVDVPTGQVVTNDFAQMTLDLSTSGPRTTATARPSCTRSRCAPRSTRSPGASTPSQQRRVPVRFRRVARRRTTGPTTGCSARLDWLSERLDATSAIWWATPSPRPTSGCSPRSPGSTPVYHGHFKCNRAEAHRDAGAVGLRPRPVPDAGVRRHRPTSCRSSSTTTSCTRTSIRPRSCRRGPTSRTGSRRTAREALGGRPFGDGTPPGPPHPVRSGADRSRTLGRGAVERRFQLTRHSVAIRTEGDRFVPARDVVRQAGLK